MVRLVVIIAVILVACGPSREEQQVREDSIRIAAENAIKKRFEEISTLTDSISKEQSRIEASTNLLMLRNADLEASRDKLNIIKGFQLLRTVQEREQQIRSQVIVIEKLQNEVISIAYKIDGHKVAVAALKRKLEALKR